MTDRILVLLVGGETRGVAEFATAALANGVRLERESVPAEALAAARTIHPDLIAVETAGSRETPLDLLRPFLHADLDGVPVMLIVPASDLALEREVLGAGAAGVLVVPITPDDVRTSFGWAERLRVLRQRARAAAQELELVKNGQHDPLPGVIALLEHLIETALPGARDRGARIADLAGRLAERFAIPAAFRLDLERAARLHEIGRLACADLGPSASGPRPEAWPYAVATHALLDHVAGLEEVGDLVAGIYENWDGTGHPEHRMQGQIPLRSRVLRALIDFVAALEAPGRSPDRALATLSEHTGTRYDPMVVTQLEALLQGGPDVDWQGTRMLVPVGELRVGMVMAEDLYTNAGLKLVARDATLTPATLEAILRRHRAEPILHAAAVKRAAAA
jgi:response regulator RpfG family c-di-GMP phosphodiesterase